MKTIAKILLMQIVEQDTGGGGLTAVVMNHLVVLFMQLMIGIFTTQICNQQRIATLMPYVSVAQKRVLPASKDIFPQVEGMLHVPNVLWINR